MANIKSAKKRVLVAEKKNMQNKMIKSQLKTDIKKFNAAAESGSGAATTAGSSGDAVFSGRAGECGWQGPPPHPGRR